MIKSLKIKAILFFACLLFNFSILLQGQNDFPERKIAPMTKTAEIELRQKYQKLMDDCDLMVEVEYEGNFETHLNCTKQDYKSGNLKDENDYYAVHSAYAKIKHVYLNKLAYNNDMITISEQGRFVEYYDSIHPIILLIDGQGASPKVTSPGRYIVFLKKGISNAAYRQQHKDIDNFYLLAIVGLSNQAWPEKEIWINGLPTLEYNGFHTGIVLNEKGEDAKLDYYRKFDLLNENKLIEFLNTFEHINRRSFVTFQNVGKFGGNSSLISEEEQERLNVIQRAKMDSINEAFRKRPK